MVIHDLPKVGKMNDKTYQKSVNDQKSFFKLAQSLKKDQSYSAKTKRLLFYSKNELIKIARTK